MLRSARHRSKREVEAIVARLRPRPDVPAAIRKLPALRNRAVAPALVAPRGDVPAGRGTERALPLEPAAPVHRAADRPVVAPLAPERYRLQLTVGRATHDRLRRAQDLLRHVVPDGDPAAIVDRALKLLVEHLERTKAGAAMRPRKLSGRAPVSGSRRIPSAVRRAVWVRDGGQCAFVGPLGRCGETGFLEFHHVRPHAEGGKATVENISLRCRAHNQHEAERWFGPMFVKEAAAVYSVRTERGCAPEVGPPGDRRYQDETRCSFAAPVSFTQV